jgi:IclR family pca regulon transcriptional regulator
MGRVLLAALPEAEALAVLSRSELKANTPNTKTDIQELMAEFREVRAQGYALIDQELELGLCSIAVPVQNERGQTVAAINIGAPAAHVPATEMVARYLSLLREAQVTLRTVLR